MCYMKIAISINIFYQFKTGQIFKLNKNMLILLELFWIISFVHFNECVLVHKTLEGSSKYFLIYE